jgi:hypothetical protein
VTPAAVLVRELADARRRGEDFGQAWPHARAAALTAASARERREWSVVFTDQQDMWRGAFERRPAAQRALALLGLPHDLADEVQRHSAPSQRPVAVGGLAADAG